MKKYILIALFSVLGYMAQAQLVTMKSSAYSSNSIDTVTNGATKYLDNAASVFKGKYAVVSVFVTVTEISGTTAGTVSLEVSPDGTVWADAYGGLDSSFTHSPSDVTTAQTFKFELKDVNHQYYRVKYVGSGTMSAKFTAKIVATKP